MKLRENRREMIKYLVGGAVRDFLLNIDNNDMDYVVVDSSVQEMLSLGYEQVGKSFPVFLDSNGDQYALARREISTGVSHHDFKFEINNVSLKDDLFRRDLTINALAMDEDGNILDFFNGKRDLNDKVIRHVSSAFKEDPLRLFRVARFATKFDDFSIASETIDLLKEMVSNGAVLNISKERIYEEFNKAIVYPKFYRFLEVLNEVNALQYMPFLNFNSEEIDFIKNSNIIDENIELKNLFLLVYTMVKFNKEPNFKIKFYDSETNDFFSICFNWLTTIKQKDFNSLSKLYNQKSIAMVSKFKHFLNDNEITKINNILNDFNSLSQQLSILATKTKNGKEIAEFKIEFIKNMIGK